MKRLFLLLTLAINFPTFAQTVKFSSATPEVGKPISFEYDPRGGTLERLTNITCNATMYFDRDSRGKIKVNLKKIGEIYKGEFTPLDSAQLAVLVFAANESVDENPKGYLTRFYKNGTATAMSVFLEGYLYAIMGKGLANIKLDLPKALALYSKAFALDPKLKTDYINNYLLTLYTIDKVKGERAVYETISSYNKEPTEYNLLKISPLYNIVKKKAAGDSVMASIKVKYPIGAYALSLESRPLRAIKDAYKREERFNEILREFKLDLSKKGDVKRLNWFFEVVGLGFADINSYDKAVFYLDKFEPKSIRAIFYHQIAQKNAMARTNLAFAEKISKKAVDLIDSMKNEPVPKHYASREENLIQLDETGVPYLLTYVTILDLLGKSDLALAAITEAVNKNNFKNAELNTLYVNMLTKSGKNEEAEKYAVQFIKSGMGNSKIKADLKMVYKGNVAFETYYVSLEKDANAKQREEFIKEMIDIPAPKFALTNLKGEKVDLANLKGKVVIIDYWATWCGPCISSFPGMQMAVDKYKADPNVVFLFINTWEKPESKEREKLVRAWMLANPKYTFNVLLDMKDISNPEEYEVISKYKVGAIPTKFIIDANGNIRFKKIGSSDVAETIVKELDLMISLAKDGK